MKISSKRTDQTWDLTKTAKLTYRIAESLDRDVAVKTATGYGRAVLSDAAAFADFGLIEQSQAEILESLSKSEDDFHGFANHFYAVALAERLVSAVDGIEIDGEVMIKSRKDFSTLFRDANLQAEWISRATAQLHRRSAAGNA